MEETSFDKLAEEAAAGLRSDRELYLDVHQELRSHLDDTAERLKRQGHDAKESVALAKKSFGSPVDVAAELLNANRHRMRLRALMRLAINALVIPLAILFAL